MRRLRMMLAFVVLGLALTPVPADAYFWAWLDDWSGPRFMGTEVEWRVWCQADQPWQNRPLLLGVRRRIEAEAAEYRRFAGNVNPNREIAKEFQLAVDYADAAITLIEQALRAADYPPDTAGAVDEQTAKSKRKLEDARRNWIALRAVAWRETAAAQFTWARRRLNGAPDDPMMRPDQPDMAKVDLTRSDIPAGPDLTVAEKKAHVASISASLGGGIVLSACGVAPLQRERQYLSLKFGWAFDAKDRNEVYDHRMVTIGASYNVVATPFLTVGSGAGLAILTSKARDPFYKFYVTPSIVDFRPFAVGRNGRSRGPWSQVFFLRYSTMVVPTGFDPGSFGGQTERYAAELTNNVGLHADLTPVIRKLQGKW